MRRWVRRDEIFEDLGRSGEIWGDLGRSGEIWGDDLRRRLLHIPSKLVGVEVTHSALGEGVEEGLDLDRRHVELVEGRAPFGQYPCARWLRRQQRAQQQLALERDVLRGGVPVGADAESVVLVGGDGRKEVAADGRARLRVQINDERACLLQLRNEVLGGRMLDGGSRERRRRRDKGTAGGSATWRRDWRRGRRGGRRLEPRRRTHAALSKTLLHILIAHRAPGW